MKLRLDFKSNWFCSHATLLVSVLSYILVASSPSYAMFRPFSSAEPSAQGITQEIAQGIENRNADCPCNPELESTAEVMFKTKTVWAHPRPPYWWRLYMSDAVGTVCGIFAHIHSREAAQR